MDEYNALRTLEKNKAGFRYVVACVDNTELPLFAEAKLFKQDRDWTPEKAGADLGKLAAAKRPNITMKLGGLAGKRNGFGFERRTTPASEEEIVALWRPYIETCIELFGPSRCMFESNYLPDKHAGHYRTLWNVFKRIAAGASASERADLFRETANRIYRVI